MEATIFGKSRRSSTSNIAMHKQSYSITKTKPNIRIIHIFAPEIIKTDVANFRELVQSLTGKPEDHHNRDNHQKASKTKPRRDHHRQVQDTNNNNNNNNNNNHVLMINSEAFGLDGDEISMTWNGNSGVGESSSGGFLNGLGDFEGFIQELGDFPYLPLSSMDASASSNSSSSSHLHGSGSFFSDSHHQFA